MSLVAKQVTNYDLGNTSSELSSIKLIKKVPLAPKVGDNIFVPDNNKPNTELSYIAKKLVGGYATVQRVVSSCDEDGNILHFINVTEHSGYIEYRWEGFLAEMQEDLSKLFNTVNRAYLKSI